MSDRICIDNERDVEGIAIENTFVVTMSGVPFDESGVSECYFSSKELADSFANEVSLSTGVEIERGLRAFDKQK